jgi:O-antigen/teichoic acid export membrane protein
MTETAVAPTPARRMMRGGLRVLLAESLLIPSGLLTAAYLARRLGPDGYGIFVVAAALVAWLEWGLTGLFSRASVKFVAEAEDWRPIGATIASVHLALATVAAALLAASAGVIARVLDTPSLADPLRLFALDIPLFCLAQAHRSILVGVGNFEARAAAAAARWVSRLLLVILLVELGLSIHGAVLGSIGASLVEVIVCRRVVRPALSARATRGLARLWSVVAPLLVSALALRLFDRLDLVTLTALGGTPEEAGHYGAAQNLSLLPSLVSLSFAPLLLAALTQAFRDGRGAAARQLGEDAMRWVILLLPFVGLCAGASRGIVQLVFGPDFVPTAPLVAPLLLSAVALVLGSVGTVILTAAGRPGLTAAFTAPVPVVAGLAYLVVIPRYGSLGAALVTLVTSLLAALSLCVAVFRVCRVHPPVASLLQSGLVAAAAYAAATLWAASGALVLLELAVLAAASVLALAILGELTPGELAALRACMRRERQPAT